MTIPASRYDPGATRYLAILFAAASLLFVVLAIRAAAWGIQSRQTFAIALILMLAGLAAAMGYEAAAVWQQNQSQLPSVSQLANRAFRTNETVWIAVYFAVTLVAGALTLHFTRLVQQPPQWGLLATGVLFMINGAALAYWFNWLP